MDIKAVLNFLSNLRENNNKEWFNTNKETYISLNNQIKALTSDLILAINQFDSRIGALSVENCLYRIYRDTRFSKDKTPMKTHIGIFICKGGKKSTLPGYYVHFEPGCCMISGGVYCPEKEELKEIRNYIFNDPESFAAVLNDNDFKNNFNLWQEYKLKTLPKGFAKNTPADEFLKYQCFVPEKRFSDSEFISNQDNFVEFAIENFKKMYKFNSYFYEIMD